MSLLRQYPLDDAAFPLTDILDILMDVYVRQDRALPWIQRLQKIRRTAAVFARKLPQVPFTLKKL